jgi:hypothetical protein
MLLESTNLELQGHDYLEVHALDVGHVHVVGRWADIFVLLVGEDVDADHVDLGVAVLASLGGRHFDNLAGATLKLKRPLIIRTESNLYFITTAKISRQV